MELHFYVVQNEHFYLVYHAIWHQKQRENLNKGCHILCPCCIGISYYERVTYTTPICTAVKGNLLSLTVVY
jgi:hypothetical protein